MVQEPRLGVERRLEVLERWTAVHDSELSLALGYVRAIARTIIAQHEIVALERLATDVGRQRDEFEQWRQDLADVHEADTDPRGLSEIPNSAR